MKTWVLVLGTILFLVVGPIPLVAGVVLTWSNWSEYRAQTGRRENWVEAEAEVTWCSVRDASGRPASWPYTYRMQWTDAAGQAHQSEASSRDCTVGRRYPVRYDPEHPDRMDEGRERFTPTPLILSLIGLGFTFVGVKEWRKASRGAPPNARA
jgi:hypothetical protein